MPARLTRSQARHGTCKLAQCTDKFLGGQAVLDNGEESMFTYFTSSHELVAFNNRTHLNCLGNGNLSQSFDAEECWVIR